MSNYPYLISIVLIEQDGKRFMPMGGKSLKEVDSSDSLIKLKAFDVALELLLRVLEKSESGKLKRLAKEKSLLIAKLELNSLQQKFPFIKKEWIINGRNQQFISSLLEISEKAWFMEFTKYEGITFKSLI